MPPACPATLDPRLTEDLRAYGSIDALCEALAQDQAADALAAALAHRRALAEDGSPGVRARRLRRQAEGLDARAASALAQAAELHGRAAYRAAQGDAGLAAEFRARAEAADRLATQCGRRADALRLEAAAAQMDADFAEHLLRLPHAMA